MGPAITAEDILRSIPSSNNNDNNNNSNNNNNYDLIHRALIKAGFPAVKEPQGLLRSDSKRPDGITLILWKACRNLIWDATHHPASATRAGTAAGFAEDPEIQRPPSHPHFCPSSYPN